MPYADAGDIGNEDDLWRRTAPEWIFYDPNIGRVRPTSAAFKDSSSDGTPLSVLLGREDTPERALGGAWRRRGFSLAAFKAGLAREHRQLVCRDPQPEDPPHVLVVGKKSHRVREALALAAQWVVPPAPGQAPGDPTTAV